MVMVSKHMTDDDIHRLKNEFDSLLESSYDGIILADADSILNVNASFGHELMSVLEIYEWPGNVRELRNVVERLAVTADTDVLTPRHLPLSMRETAFPGLPYAELPSTMNLKIARPVLESGFIKRDVAKTGSMRKAAKLLGVDHSTVILKAQK